MVRDTLWRMFQQQKGSPPITRSGGSKNRGEQVNKRFWGQKNGWTQKKHVHKVRKSYRDGGDNRLVGSQNTKHRMPSFRPGGGNAQVQKQGPGNSEVGPKIRKQRGGKSRPIGGDGAIKGYSDVPTGVKRKQTSTKCGRKELTHPTRKGRSQWGGRRVSGPSRAQWTSLQQRKGPGWKAE